MKVITPALSALLAISFVGGSGCSILKPKADLTQFYILQPQPTTASARTVGPMEIRIGPGELADYLENTRIVVQQEPYRVNYLDLYRWAEPPSKGISRVVSENLASLLKGAHLIRYPEPASTSTGYEVRYSVERFEGSLAGPVSLEVTWQVVKRPTGDVIVGKHSTYTVPVQDKAEDVGSYVQRLSAALARWSDEIAASMPSH